jgi:uncharacterized membrane protein YdjX (TVP38/TMEM64 family)
MGALVGGSIAYFWGAHDHTIALTVMERIPAVSTDMIGRVSSELVDRGAWAIMFGSVSGTPYKLYAASAADTGISFWLFFLISIPGPADSLCLGYSILSLRTQGYWIGGGVKGRPLMILLLAWVLFYLGDAKLTE